MANGKEKVKFIQRKPYFRIGALIVGTIAVAGAGMTRDPAPEPVEPVRLSAVDVAPTAEQIAAREERLAREAAVARAVEYYGIRANLARRIYDAAVQEGIDPTLGYALVRVESRFEPDAVGPAGAIGLAQVMLPTARTMNPDVTRRELMTPEPNLRLGFRHLRWLLDRYDADTALALTAYNRGHGTVERARNTGEKVYNGYATLVFDSRLGE